MNFKPCYDPITSLWQQEICEKINIKFVNEIEQHRGTLNLSYDYFEFGICPTIIPSFPVGFVGFCVFCVGFCGFLCGFLRFLFLWVFVGIPTDILWEWVLKFYSHGNPDRFRTQA